MVNERLSHANIQMTPDTYSHILPRIQEAAVLRFDGGLNMRLVPEPDLERGVKLP